jgi:hypothetical protein
MTSEINQTVCANCGADLAGKYCASCGQKAAPLNPSAGDLLHEAAHELLHVDGKIVSSVHLLLTSPGTLTREYAAGRRARHIPPLRLYLVLSVIYFAVTTFTPSMNFRLTVGAQKTSGMSFDATPSERRSDPEALRKLGFKTDEELREAAGDAVVHWLPRAMFLLVPLFAVMVGLTVRRLGRKYPQHLSFALHVHAAWFLLMAVGRLARLVPVSWVGAVTALAVAVLMVAYLVAAFRRAYDLTIPGAIGRTAGVGISYALLIAAAFVAIILPLVVARG